MTFGIIRIERNGPGLDLTPLPAGILTDQKQLPLLLILVSGFRMVDVYNVNIKVSKTELKKKKKWENLKTI